MPPPDDPQNSQEDPCQKKEEEDQVLVEMGEQWSPLDYRCALRPIVALCTFCDSSRSRRFEAQSIGVSNISFIPTTRGESHGRNKNSHAQSDGSSPAGPREGQRTLRRVRRSRRD